MNKYEVMAWAVGTIATMMFVTNLTSNELAKGGTSYRHTRVPVAIDQFSTDTIPTLNQGQLHTR